MGIRDKPIAPGSPWQNSFAERLIGTIRRECVDHVVAWSEQHLRQIVKSYANYYNSARTHGSLDKDAPVSRPVQRIGRIVSHAMVGGLHHQICSNLSFWYAQRAIYSAHKDKLVKAQNKLWQDVIAEDFSLLQAAGLFHRMMNDVVALLGITKR